MKKMSDNVEYNAWAKKFFERRGYLPRGTDILLYWEKNPEIKKQMCPNPCRIPKDKVKK